VQIDKLYRCLDKLLSHKEGLFSYLRQRWQVLFDVGFEVLLYDLTSTYFESDPPEGGKRRFGYSCDKRPDCVPVVIALTVTPQGFPLVYEIMAGNTSDKTTLTGFLKKIEKQYGKAQRTWVMDRGIPTEETSLVILDTGPLVALINRADNFHAWAKAQFGTIHPSVITCEAVIAESWFLLRHLPAGQQALLRLVHQG
jgi:hypothetical protein